MKYAPSATAQRLIEANALPLDSLTQFHLSTAWCRDLLPRRVQGARLCRHPPRGGDVFSSTTCSSATSSTATPVYGHTCTRSALVHPRRPLCDSRTSRAVRSRASAVSLPASNVRHRRRLRPARRPPSSAHRARCRCKMAHGMPGTVDTDLPLPPPDFTGLREIGDVRARFVITVRQCVCPTLAHHRPVKIKFEPVRDMRGIM